MPEKRLSIVAATLSKRDKTNSIIYKPKESFKDMHIQSTTKTYYVPVIGRNNGNFNGLML